ncbi:MAG: methyltransferase domain-containing protein [Thermoplasmata archaeon]
MPGWDTQRYLQFAEERTQPCRDLVSRIDLARPRRIVDLGCGPGTSTSVLLGRWPAAEVVGVDSSAEMLSVARRLPLAVRWVEEDVRRWSGEAAYDLVFSNAALQWVPDHPHELLRLWERVAPGGALAFQVPARAEPPPGWIRALADVRRRPRWHATFGEGESDHSILSLEGYYDVIAPRAQRIDLWETSTTLAEFDAALTRG